MQSIEAQDKKFLAAAVSAVKKAVSRSRNAIPIGAALVIDGKVRSVGTNQRVQKGSAILHGETACIENAGTSVSIEEYSRATLYTTLSPCYMCAGTILRFNIPRVVIAENRNFEESELLLKLKGVDVTVLDDQDCYQRMKEFIAKYPEVWNGDITDARLTAKGQRPRRIPVSSAPLTPELALRICKALGFTVPMSLNLPELENQATVDTLRNPMLASS